MHITQNEIVAIVLILSILWVWFTWDKTTEGFTNLKVPAGKKWGDYVYYEDDNEYPIVAPSITRIDDSQYKVPEQPLRRPQLKINTVDGISDTTNATGLGAPFKDVVDFEDSLIRKLNYSDTSSQDSIVHELPKSHDHPIAERAKQILTEEELMPGMVQKKKMEDNLKPVVEVPVIKPQPKKKKAKKVSDDRKMALIILGAVLLIGFVQKSQS